jgi:hypothetical protein
LGFCVPFFLPCLLLFSIQGKTFKKNIIFCFVFERINKMYKEEGVAAFYHGMFSYDNILATCAETPLTTLIAFVLTIIGGVSA